MLKAEGTRILSNNGTILLELLCVNQLSITITNIWENQLINREGLLWLTVLEVLVHNWLALLL
jgi:hypothetical protein